MKSNKIVTKRLNFQFQSVVQTKDAASGECYIEGFANTSSKDRVGDVVLPKAFEKSLPTYLNNPILLANHDWNDVCGVVKSAEIRDTGLYIKARISDTRPDIKTLIGEGCLRTFSIGYNMLDADFDESTKTQIVKELELLEISIVSVPANVEAVFGRSADEVAVKPSEAPKPNAGKSAKELMGFIETVKSAIGNELGDDTVIQICNYFNSNEEIMTKEQLIEALRVKTAIKTEAAPAVAPVAAKADAPAEAAPAEPAKSDDMAMLSAKLDAIAEALAQLLEAAQKDEAEDAVEDANPEAVTDAAKAVDACECGGAMKPAAEDASKTKCEKCGKDGEAKASDEMKDEDIEKSLAEINEQLALLDEQVNG